MAAVIGALRGVLSLDSAAFEKGVKRAQASMGNMQRSLARSGAAMQSLGRKMSLSVTAPLAGLATVSLAASRGLTEIDNQARVAGISAQRFKELSLATKDLGVEQGKLSDVLKDVNDKFGDYFQTGAGPLADFFENIAPKVGLTQEAFKGLSSDQALQKYINALREANVNQAEMTFYLEALASDATLLLPAFDNGGKAIADVTEKARAFGLTLDKDMIAKSRAAASEMAVVSEVLKTKLQVALAGLAPLFADIVSEFSPVIEKLADGAQKLADRFQELSPQVKRFVTLGAALAAALGPVLIGLGLMASLLAAISSPVLLVAAGFAALVGAGAALAANWDTISERYPALAGAIEGGVSLLGGAVGVVRDAVVGVADFALLQLETALTGVSALLQGDWAGAWEAGRTAVVGWKDAFVDVGVYIDELMGGWPSKVLDNAAAMAESFQRGIAEMGAEAVATIKALWADIWAEISTWPARFLQIGRDLIDGLIQGIKESPGRVRDAIGDIVEDALSWAKQKLGIQSPSKEFREIGGYSIAGLIEGIEEGAAPLERAIRDVTGGSLDAAADEMLGLQSVFDGVLDGTIRSWDDALETMWQAFRSWLSNMIFAGASNPIQIGGAFLGAGGGGAGIAQAALGGGNGLLGGLSTGLGGLIGSWGGTGILGGASGLIQNTLANGFSGFTGYISSALSGATTSLAGFGTALGAIALPLAGVGLIMSGLRKKTTVLSESLQITADGFDVALEKVTKTQTSRWWGLSKKTSKDTDDITTNEFTRAAAAIQNSVRDMAASLNIGTEALANFTYKAKWDAGELTGDALSDAVAGQLELYGDALAEAVLSAGMAAEGMSGTWRTLADEGQSATDVLSSLATNLQGVNKVFDYMGKAMFDVSVSSAIMADNLVDLFGSLDQFNTSVTTYMELFYSAEERVALQTKALTKTLHELGLNMPETRQGFRDLVEAQDLTTASGRKVYAALIQVAAGFNEVFLATNSLSLNIVGAFDGVLTAINTAISEANTNMRAAETAAQAWRQTADTLEDFMASLTARYSPGQSFAAAQQAYSSTLLKALAGDQDAATAFPDIASTMLNGALAQSSSRAEYEHIVKRTQNDTARLADSAAEQASYQETMVRLYEEQTGVLEQMADFISYANSLSADQIVQMGGMKAVLSGIDAAMTGYQGGLDAINTALANPLKVDFAALDATLARALKPANLFGSFGEILAARLRSPMDALYVAMDNLQKTIEAEIKLLARVHKVQAPTINKTTQKDNSSEIAKLNEQLQKLANAGLYWTQDKVQEAYERALNQVQDRGDVWTSKIYGRAVQGQQDEKEEREAKLAALRSQIRSLGGTPRYASGTDFHTGGLAMVHGPELVNLPRGSNVTSVSDTKSLFGALTAEITALRKDMAALESRNALLLQKIAGNTRTTATNSNDAKLNGLKVEVLP